MKYNVEPVQRPQPQTGDVFFVPSQGKLGHRMIVAYQKLRQGLPHPHCNFVHTGIVNDWPSGIHSTFSRGVHVIDNISVTYPDAIIMRHRQLDHVQMSGIRNKIRGDLLERLGDTYDWLSILGFAFVLPALIKFILSRKQPDFNDINVFCSELVVRAFRGRQIPLVQSMDAEKVTPGLLAMQPEMIYIGRAISFLVEGIENQVTKIKADFLVSY